MTYIFENFKYQTLNEKYNYFIFIKNYIYIYIKIKHKWVGVGHFNMVGLEVLYCALIIWKTMLILINYLSMFYDVFEICKKNSYKFFSYNNFPCLVTCCIIHNMLLGCNNIYAKNILNFIEFKTTTLKLVFKPQ